MSNIIGIDLGTNSIGWAIRDLSETENQLIDYGVLTFEKGVGEGKSGEFPLVQKRTESRGKRRSYQAEKYRKWALLKVLIDNGMCPLSTLELDEWRKYTKDIGRRYPTSEKFIQWLRFDFDGDGKPDFERFGFSRHESHYLFRMLAASEAAEHKQIFEQNPHILGRVFYHLVQRRGFRGRDDAEAKTIMEGSKETGTHGVNELTPFIQQYKTLGSALYHLHKDRGERIRKRYNLRGHYEQELKEICRVQNIDDAIYKKLWQAIIWQRPLRTQKGLVGVCTFEKNKSRCPVSHPLYEEFRTWVTINNLKIQLPDEVDRASFLQQKIYPLFYNASRDFKLTAITRELRKVNGCIKGRFHEETKVISATLLASFEKLFGKDWKEHYGWHELLQNQPKNCAYSFEDIWHVLFTFDDRDKLRTFAKEKLALADSDAERFVKIDLKKGYASLSLSAIKKILPYLQQGFIYSHAVYLANAHKMLGKDHITYDEAQHISMELSKIMSSTKNERTLITAVNGLISDRLNGNRYGMDASYKLDTDDKNDILNKLIEEFGEQTWNEKKSATERESDIEFVSRNYQNFLRKPIHDRKDLFLKPQTIHDRIFNYFKDAYGVSEEKKKFLWHPSEQEIYRAATEKNGIPQLGDPQPISRGFKNPMALKTLYKLKGLLNYLLQAGKVDEDTRVVIEIARELNDTNKRKAIERWQREREKQNYEYLKKIREIAVEYNLSISEDDEGIVNRYRLWEEQHRRCLYTGATISCTDLFNGARYDLEHTVPASISFDNELKNLTIADGYYNKQIKGNKLPTALPNYNDEFSYNGKIYAAIKPGLEFMEKKVKELEDSLQEWKNKTKFASDKSIKDACIQRKHFIGFELDYWRRKLDTFTISEYKASWRNSQLRDTQVITKYALPYLKTIFHKVDVQKGAVTKAFREIYGVQPRDERKDRSNHSHHAIDAAVLTLIPPAASRDKILLEYNKAKDRSDTEVYHEPVTQWKNFHVQYIHSIRDNVLINFQTQNRVLLPVYKKVYRRGKIQKVDGSNGKVPLIAQGDSIRGQLHKESFYGVIDCKGEKILVERYPISSFTSISDCRNIVDDKVREIVTKTLEERMVNGYSFDKAKMEPVFFPNRKEIIKKVRCRVAAGRGYLTPEKALPVKKHTFLSDKDYKQYVYAQNEENALCLLYEGKLDNKPVRAFKIIGLYDLAQLKLNSFEEIKHENYYASIQAGKGKNKTGLGLVHIITAGMKAILYQNDKEELKELPKIDLLKRLYRIYKFNEPAPSTVYVYLQHHLEARKNDELGTGDKEVILGRSQPRIFLNAVKFNCALEGRDFNVNVDGSINWLF
jgi:CRISPR-associated endonuclease Csn1